MHDPRLLSNALALITQRSGIYYNGGRDLLHEGRVESDGEKINSETRHSVKYLPGELGVLGRTFNLACEDFNPTKIKQVEIHHCGCCLHNWSIHNPRNHEAIVTFGVSHSCVLIPNLCVWFTSAGKQILYIFRILLSYR